MGQDTFIDWQLGTQAAFDKASLLGVRNDDLLCRRPGMAPLSAWSRSVALHGQRTRVDEAQGASARFARLSNTEKLDVALRSAAYSVGPEIGGKLQELISPTNVAIMAGALAIWVGAHATPIGWVVDIGMVGLGVVALGAEAVNVMRELHAFGMGVIKAQSEIALMEAGRHLAKAVAIVGVDVVVAILLKKAIVKVRQPGPAAGVGAGEAAGGPKLFGKYDSQDAVKSLPAESQVAGKTTGATSAAKVAGGASPLHGADRAVIDPRKLTEYALNPDHPVGGNKARVFESALGFNKGNADDLLSQIRQGVANNPAVAGKVDQFGARYTVDIPVVGPTGSGVVRSGWIYKTGSDIPELTTIFVK